MLVVPVRVVVLFLVITDNVEVQSLWMPYRSPQGWEDYGDNLYESRKVSGINFEDLSDEEFVDYFSADADWVMASSIDKARK